MESLITTRFLHGFNRSICALACRFRIGTLATESHAAAVGLIDPQNRISKASRLHMKNVFAVRLNLGTLLTNPNWLFLLTDLVFLL
jgi:hypothetical protein